MRKIYNPETNGEITERNNLKLLNRLATIMLVVCAVFCVFAYITSRTFYIATVEGSSMFPTINSMQKSTKVNDVAYYTYTKTAKKGDIIIVDYAGAGEDIDAIKRLIATGGDTICYYGGSILLNGEVLKEQYIEEAYNMLKNNEKYLYKSGFASADDWLEKGYQKSKTSFEKWCETLLDNGLTAEQKDAKLADTTFFKKYETDFAGSVTYSEVLGTYVLTVPENYIYFLGDNRSGSRDSSIIGPLESKHLLAKVSFISSGNASIWTNFFKELKYLFV